MKQLITLLLISLMVLSACEPLQTPPDTIETDIQVFNSTGTSTPEPLPRTLRPRRLKQRCPDPLLLFFPPIHLSQRQRVRSCLVNWSKSPKAHS